MAYFWHKLETGEDIQIYFNLCKNGDLASNGRAVFFDYLEHYMVHVRKSEVDTEEWLMLMQVLNLPTSS